jgi:phage terminase large subunit-like protein
MTTSSVTNSPKYSAPSIRPLKCPPTWGTPRNYDRPTLGPAVGLISRMLGEPFMPWQQHVADVMMEVDPKTGLLVYREYVLVIGRQNGKTSFVRSKLAHRHLGFTQESPESGRRRQPKAQHTVYTAQTADKAREKWLHDQVHKYQASPLAENIAYVRERLNGERLEWTNGSSHRPVTPSAKTGGVGDSLDEAVIDEAWAREDDALEAALLPTMATRDQPQLGITSTAKKQPKGHHSTTFAAYLRAKILAGRERIRSGIDSDTAFFDWSAPLDKDPGDPRTWHAHLPAMSTGLITEKAMASNFATMERANFCAEFLGWFEDESAAL